MGSLYPARSPSCASSFRRSSNKRAERGAIVSFLQNDTLALRNAKRDNHLRIDPVGIIRPDCRQGPRIAALRALSAPTVSMLERYDYPEMELFARRRHSVTAAPCIASKSGLRRIAADQLRNGSTGIRPRSGSSSLRRASPKEAVHQTFERHTRSRCAPNAARGLTGNLEEHRQRLAHEVTSRAL
jgi:hypothetical protein